MKPSLPNGRHGNLFGFPDYELGFESTRPIIAADSNVVNIPSKNHAFLTCGPPGQFYAKLEQRTCKARKPCIERQKSRKIPGEIYKSIRKYA